MVDDKAETRIGKHDAGQLNRWHRNAAPEQEVRKTAKARTGSGAAPGNQNSLRHGIYADRFLSPEERPLFEPSSASHQDFVFNKSSDFMRVELVAVYFLAGTGAGVRRLGCRRAVDDDPLPPQGPQGHQDRP